MSDNKNTTKSQLNALRAEYIRLSKELIENRLLETSTAFFLKHPKVQSIKVESSEQYNDQNYYTSFVIDDPDGLELNGVSTYNYEEESDYEEGPALTEDEHGDAANDAIEIIFDEFDSEDFINVYGDNFSIKITSSSVTITD